MAYASIICETCKNKKDTNCYCAPNSVCDKYTEDTESVHEGGEKND